MKKLKKFLTVPNFFLLTILVIAAFLRFYNLENNYMFQGDQGRDALVVANIFKELDPVFIGPVTSIGNMYLGPFYYYFMLPFLLISYPNPIGPVYAVATLGVITVAVIYLVCKKIFDHKTAILVSIFFTFSNIAVQFSRFSWNPNPAPFFSILMFYFTYLAWKKNSRYWLLVSAMFSILIQLHYVTLLSIGGAVIIFLINLKEKIKNEQRIQLFKHSLLALLIFLLSLTPLILFDWKHDWRNWQAFKNIFSKEQSFDLTRKSGREGVSAFSKLISVDLQKQSKKVLFSSSLGNLAINDFFTYFSLGFLLFYLIKNRKKIKDQEILLFSYLLTGLLGLSIYQHEVYSHYFVYFLPIVYIFYAWLLTRINNKWFFYLISSLFLVFFIRRNFQLYTFEKPGWTIEDVKMVASDIQEKVGENTKYNLVLLSESKDLYGMNYRYFLSSMKNPPLKIEDHHLAEQLVIINEEKKESDLLKLEIYEIAVFPHKNIVEQYQYDPGPEITILGEVENNYNNH